jgi:large subunit ribosomal protein L25
MEVTLEAVRRGEFGKNAMRRMRATGRIPGVLYGGPAAASGKPEATPIAVDPKALMKILHSDSGANTLITLTVDGGGAAKVMLREYQLDPVTHHLLHVDFYRVAMDKLVRVTVPVIVKGEAPGVKQQSGILDFVHREIEVECLPTDIPEHVEVDVSELMLGQSVRLRDLVQQVKWTPVSDPDLMLVHVITPRIVEEAPKPAEAEAAATPAEPEVIKKGKAEKAEGEEEEKEKEKEKKEKK